MTVNDNRIEILATLGIDTKESATNINSKIAGLERELKQAKVSAKLNIPESVKLINKGLTSIQGQLKQLNVGVGLDKKAFENIKKQMTELKQLSESSSKQGSGGSGSRKPSTYSEPDLGGIKKFHDSFVDLKASLGKDFGKDVSFKEFYKNLASGEKELQKIVATINRGKGVMEEITYLQKQMPKTSAEGVMFGWTTDSSRIIDKNLQSMSKLSDGARVIRQKEEAGEKALREKIFQFQKAGYVKLDALAKQYTGKHESGVIANIRKDLGVLGSDISIAEAKMKQLGNSMSYVQATGKKGAAGQSYASMYGDLLDKQEKEEKAVAKRIVTERQKLMDKLNKTSANGYGNNKEVTSLIGKVGAANTIDDLKVISREVDTFNGKLAQLGRKSNVNNTIKSLETLVKNGSVRLPKGNMIDDLKAKLANAETKQQVDAIVRQVNRLKQTLNGREKLLLQIEKLRAEDILPQRELSILRERIRKAQTPENVQSVKMDISRLTTTKKAITEERALYAGLEKQLESLHSKNLITLSTFQRFNRSISSAQSVQQLQQIEKALDRVQNKASFSNKNIDLQIFKQRQLDALEKFEKMNGKVIKQNPELKAGIDRQRSSIEGLTTSTLNLSRVQKQIVANMGSLRVATQESSRSSLGLIEAFNTAMVKFPVWMAATTAFYGSIQAAGTFMSIIVDIDSKMTTLKMVSGQTDLSPVFERATESAEQYGQTISKVMDATTEFARQGFKGEDLNLLSDAAIIAGNVADMETGKAAEYLTSSMVQWKMEAKDAMGVIDSWNEVSNNYATTTEKLAQGQARAGATARAMGLDFDQLNGIVGTVTAATKQSGNEVGNFVKSVLPRLTSKPAQDALKAVGVAFKDEDGNMRDVIEIYSEVAQKTKEMSSDQRIAVTEGLAGKYHITRMQAFLDDLGSANSLYQQIYKSSTNATGSAMRENELFMESLQARINRAKVAIEKLALAFGEAFLTNGMVVALETFTSLTTGIAKIASEAGALPLVLGAVTIAVLALNEGMRKSAIASGAAAASFGRVALTSSAMATGILLGTTRAKAQTAAMGALAVATRAFGVAARFAVGSILPLAGIMAAGWGLEKLISKIGESKKALEGLKDEQKDTIKNYSENKDKLKELADQYGELSKLAGSPTADTQDLEKFNEVRNEMARLLPSLAIGEDEYGNKILNTSGVIKNQITLLDEQLDRYERLAEAKRNQQIEEDYQTSKEGLNDARSDLKTFQDSQFNQRDVAGVALDILPFDFGGALDSIEQAREKYNLLLEKQADLAKSGKELNFFDQTKLNSLQGVIDQYDLIDGRIKTSKDVLISSSQSKIAAALQEKDTFQDTSLSIIDGFTTMVASSKAADSEIENTFSNTINAVKGDAFRDEFKKMDAAIIEFQTAQKNNLTGVELEEYRVKAEKELRNVRDLLLEVAGSSMGGTDSAAYRTLVQNLNAQIQAFTGTKAAADEAASSQLSLKSISEMSTEEVIKNAIANRDNADALTEEEIAAYAAEEGISEETAAIELNTKNKYENMTAAEMMLGISQENVDKTFEMIEVYNTLSKSENLNEAQKYALSDATKHLTSMYPSLITEKGLNIEAMRKETESNNILLAASKASAQGLLSAQEQATLGTALATKSRIEQIKFEIRALQARTAAYAKASQVMQQLPLGGIAGLALQMQSISASTFDVSGYVSELDSLQSSLSSTTSDLADIPAIQDEIASGSNRMGKEYKDAMDKAKEANDAASKAQKENGETVETQIQQYDLFTFTADRYANALNRVNTALAKQQAILAKYPDWSKGYRESLKEQLELLAEQRKLTNTQHSDLWSQIKTGNFKQYGVYANGSTYGVETTKTTTGSGGTSSSGGANQVAGVTNSSKIWNFFAQKGFNPVAIAGIMGNLKQESQLKTDITNPTSGAYGLGQWLGSRKTGLKNYAKQQGKSVTDLNLQLEWLWKELNGADSTTKSLLDKKGGLEALKKNTDLASVVKIFESAFERSGGSAMSKRNNYAKEILGSFGSTSTSAASTTTSAASSSNPYQYGSKGVADYYLKEFRSSNDFGQTRSDGKKHWGIDFNKNGTSGNQDMGTPILNLVSGVIKQVFKNNKTAGNGVVIQGDDGKEYRYIHMEKEPNFKTGQRVASGEKLGGIGNSGSGTYAHLDLKVKDSKGNYLNPMKVLQDYSNNGGSSSASSTTTTVSNTNPQAQAQSEASRAAAELLSNENDARQKLLDLTQELYAIDGQIEEIRHSIIMSYVSEVEHAAELKDIAIQKYKNETYWMKKTSQEYRENLLLQRKQAMEKQAILAQEEAVIRNLMKNTQMSERTRWELQQQLDGLNSEKIANAELRDGIQWDIITSSMAEYQEQIDKTTKSLEKLRAVRERLEPGSRQYRESIAEEAKLLAERNKILMEEINTSNRQAYYYKLTPEQEKERQENLDTWNSEIIANNNEIEQMQKDLADSIVDAVKQGYEQMRDLDVAEVEKALEKFEEKHEEKVKTLEETYEKEREIAEKAHEEEMERYEEEAEEFNDLIDAKIKALNRESSSRSYDNDVKDLQKEETEIRKQINELMIDDSYEANAKREDLEEQLQEILKQKEDLQYNRSVELQTDALEDLRENNQNRIDEITDTLQEEYDEKTEIAEKAHKEELKRLDDLLKAEQKKAKESIENINWKYNEILNDEKRWNDLRNDVLEGKSNVMQGHLNRLIDGMKDYSASALKELEISATAMESLLEKLRDAGQDLGLIENLEGSRNESPHEDTTFQEKNEAWNKYLSNKRKYDRPETTYAEKQQLAKDNEALRQKWNFADGAWEDLERLDIYSTGKDAKQDDRMRAWAEYITNKEKYPNAKTTEDQKKLQARNLELRTRYNFPDAPLNVLKKIDADQIAAGVDSKVAEKVRDWYKYLQNKRDYASAGTGAEQKRMQQENATLRNKWMFPDGDLTNLLTLDPTKFHDGGITGGKPNKLGDLLNKMFNGKPNEQVITSLLGELNVPPQNFSNGIASIREIAARMIQPLAVPVGAGLDGGIQVQFIVDKMYGTDGEAKDFGKKIIDTIKRNKGGRF